MGGFYLEGAILKMELTGGIIYWFKNDLTISLQQLPMDHLGGLEDLKKYILHEEINRSSHVPIVQEDNLLHLQDVIYKWDESIQSYQQVTLNSIKTFEAAIFSSTITVPVGDIIQQHGETVYSDAIVQFEANKPYVILGKYLAPNNELMYVISANGIVGIGIPQYPELNIIDITYGYYKKFAPTY